jgi:LPXTG-site transpeptidase (sortase) family protein
VKRPTLPAAMASVALVLTLAACSGDEEPAASPESVGLNGASKGTVSSTKAAPEKPASLKMPSIGFERAVTAMGVNKDGEINPPAGVVQWYDKSVVPGEKGISVIAGHVEYNGPDVFHKLDQLDKGDIVTVSYGDGSTKRFKVYAEEGVNKKKLQTDGRVWGSSKTPVLALITCDGQSRVVNQHHVDNYVVWAKPV